MDMITTTSRKLGTNFKDKAEVLNYIKNHKYEKYATRLDLAFAYLIVARENGDIEKVHEIASDILLENATFRFVMHFTNRNFGRYGVDEFIPVYERLVLSDSYFPVLQGAYDEYKKIEWNQILPSLCGEYQYTSQKLINHVLGLRIKHYYHDWILDKAKEIYPNLTDNYLKFYIKIRKGSDYLITLSNSTNKEIVSFCKESGINASWKKINDLRVAFGYEAEDEDTLPLRERPDWKRNHPNELYYLRHTDADLIEEEEMQLVLSTIKSVLDFTPDEMASLQTWLYRAKYHGVGDNEGVLVPDSLLRKYPRTPNISVKTSDAAHALNSMRRTIEVAYKNGLLGDSCLTLDVISRTMGNKRRKTA